MNIVTANAVNFMSAVYIPAAPAEGEEAPAGPGGLPAFAPREIPGTATIQEVVGWVLTAVAIACFLGFLFVAIRMVGAATSSHGGNGVGKALLWVLGACFLASTAGAILALML